MKHKFLKWSLVVTVSRTNSAFNFGSQIQIWNLFRIQHHIVAII